MMDHLIQTSQDAVIKLEGDPSSTIDYVNLLRSITRTDTSQTALLIYFRGWLIFRPLSTIEIALSVWQLGGLEVHTIVGSTLQDKLPMFSQQC